jgi:hypothetical protein
MPGKRKDEDLPDFGDDKDVDDHDNGFEDDDAQEGGADDKHEKGGHKAKWQDPTHEEISGYRQAEQLFKSSLLQLQITELKGEVNVDYTKLAGLEEVRRCGSCGKNYYCNIFSHRIAVAQITEDLS